MDRLRSLLSPELWTARGASLLAGILAALVILVLGRLAAKLAANMIRRVPDRSRTEPMLVKFLANLGYGLILAFVLIASRARLGVNTTSCVAVRAKARGAAHADHQLSGRSSQKTSARASSPRLRIRRSTRHASSRSLNNPPGAGRRSERNERLPGRLHRWSQGARSFVRNAMV